MTSEPHLDPANPFAEPSTLPYRLPNFTAIRTDHYLPAVEAGMAAQRAEVEDIATDPSPPTEANTLEALERSGRLLHRTMLELANRTSAHTSPELDAIEAEVAPRLAAHRDAIRLDRRLYARLEGLAARVSAGEVGLPDDAAWLLAETRREFVRAGATAPDDVQAELRELNSRISTLETRFSQMLLAETNDSAVLLTERDDLAGLPDDAVAAARQAAADRGKDGYLIELRLPTQQPELAMLCRREVRRRVHEASVVRGARGGEHDTRATLLELVRLRARRAQLLGYDHHAAYVAEDGTARSADAVAQILRRLAPAAVANAVAEATDLQAALEADLPGETLEPWDWAYYAERVRQERFRLDDAALRPYLELERVVHEGVFHAAHELYGITFAERHDLFGYQSGVRVFEVFDVDAAPLGIFLADWYTRPSKHGGAWMNNVVDQSFLLDERPVVVNNLNIARPVDGEPTLLTWDEVITLFHEFGHALHGLFSAVRFPSQSGTEVPRDFVEYPSQVNEVWAWEPSVLTRYAVHHETGEPMPAEWVRILLESRRFNEGFATTEYLAAALLDQAWHRLAPQDVPDDPARVEEFEQAALAVAGVALTAVPPRYRSSYFAHIFAGGYSAAYYSYIWSEVLDADTVQWFTENGGLRRENGEVFRRAVLARGGSLDAMDAFRELRGRDPRIEPLLARRGLGV